MRSFTVVPDGDSLAALCAEIVADRLRSTPTTRLALAGGTTPKKAYGLLAQMDLPWERATVLFGDERCVPAWHEESNYRMASETLLRSAHPGALLRMPGELGAEAAARWYEPFVAAAPLDLVLLGIGPDGHTASLFPGNEALLARGYVAAVHGAPKPPPDRVTLTLRTLREAGRVVVLVAGADKADAVRQAKAGTVPSGTIENAEWFVARDAAGG